MSQPGVPSTSSSASSSSLSSSSSSPSSSSSTSSSSTSSSAPSSSASSELTSSIAKQPQVKPASSPLRVAMETTDLTSSQPMNAFGQFTDFIDRNLQYFRLSVAVVGVAGILLIGRSIRLMKTFRAVSDIPEEFIRKQMTLRGKIKGHEGHNLLVEHLPIIRGMQGMKKGHKDSLLPVHLAGVNISDGGLTHLVTMTPVDSIIWFRLLAVDELQELECIVKRRKNLISSLMVNEALVKQGLAQVKPAHPSIALHSTTIKLIQRLSKAENYAEKKAKGIWAKPSLWERMNERTLAIKDGVKERFVSMMKPFSDGMGAVKSAGTKVGASFRRLRRPPKNG